MTALTAHRSLAASRPSAADRAVAAWLWSVAGLVLAMIAVGGATRLTESGLSITEWKPLLGAIPPLSEADWQEAFDKYRQIPQYQLVNKGMSLEDFKVIFWWEWAHRFLGRVIGLAFALPLVVFAVRGMLRQGALWKYVGVLALGGLQGAIGWYMVASGLVDRIDVSHYRLALHLSVAFLILGALVWLAMELAQPQPVDRAVPASASVWAAAIAALVFLQTALGAFVAGLNAGLVHNTWPLMSGAFVPEDLLDLTPWWLNFVENPTAVQFNHRLMAYVVVALGIWHAWSLHHRSPASATARSALALGAGLVAQMVLGIVTLLNAVPIALGVAHQTLAAIVFGLAIRHLFLVRASRSAAPAKALA